MSTSNGTTQENDKVRETDENAPETVSEKIVKAAKSEDQPMGRETPQAPFALVGLSYLAALALVVLIIAWVIFMVVGN